MAARLKDWARRLKNEITALYFAARDPRTPLLARVLALVVVAYALSPIDLIPDFIPVLGYLDDLLLVPLGVLLVIRMIPREVMEEHRAKAAGSPTPPPSRLAAAAIIVLWTLGVAAAGWLAYRYLAG